MILALTAIFIAGAVTIAALWNVHASASKALRTIDAIRGKHEP